VPEDPIEDEEMADADAEQEEQVNGAEAKEDGAERDADEESIIGD
jgi:hypothetical protein